MFNGKAIAELKSKVWNLEIDRAHDQIDMWSLRKSLEESLKQMNRILEYLNLNEVVIDPKTVLRIKSGTEEVSNPS